MNVNVIIGHEFSGKEKRNLNWKKKRKNLVEDNIMEIHHFKIQGFYIQKYKNNRPNVGWSV